MLPPLTMPKPLPQALFLLCYTKSGKDCVWLVVGHFTRLNAIKNWIRPESTRQSMLTDLTCVPTGTSPQATIVQTKEKKEVQLKWYYMHQQERYRCCSFYWCCVEFIWQFLGVRFQHEILHSPTEDSWWWQTDLISFQLIVIWAPLPLWIS